MNKLSPRNIVIAAALFGIAAESAWSEEATPSAPAAPAVQTAAPGASDTPGYAPATYPRGYERRWQPPPWPERPPGYYDDFRPYYPPYRQYRSAPAAPTENPLSAELKQTQEQLAAKSTELNTTNEQLAAKSTELNTANEELAEKSTELNTANEQLATMQAEQQATREALQQAQSEIDAASQQLGIAIEDMDIINNVLIELKAQLDVQNTSLQGAVQAGAAENDKVDSAVVSDVEQVQSPATTSAQPGSAGSTQTEVGDNELTKPEAEQEN